jgi:uncharacterized protein YegL
MSSELVQHNQGHFGFSAVGLDELGASEYTLVTIVVDRSGSTHGFQQAMENCLKELVKSCQFSDRADNLMVRVVVFEDHHEEIHGFKFLSQINASDYDGILRPGGSTALFDATTDSVEATTNYAKTLGESDYFVNGFVVVITDGADNVSKLTANSVKEAFTEAIRSETLESLMSILVAVNAQRYKSYLDDFNQQVGFSQYEEINNVDEKTFARMANWLSSSISSQSQALGSGGPSQSIAW